MIPELDRLKTYLQVVYPTNGVYISPEQPISDEWLTSILSHLDEEVATSGSETLFPGRIGWIIYAVNQGHYLPAASEVTGIPNLLIHLLPTLRRNKQQLAKQK